MLVLVHICGAAVKGFSDFDLHLFAFSEPRQSSVNTLNGGIVRFTNIGGKSGNIFSHLSLSSRYSCLQIQTQVQIQINYLEGTSVLSVVTNT